MAPRFLLLQRLRQCALLHPLRPAALQVRQVAAPHGLPRLGWQRRRERMRQATADFEVGVTLARVRNEVYRISTSATRP